MAPFDGASRSSGVLHRVRSCTHRAMCAPTALLVVFALSVAVDALTREQAKENKLCRKVKKRKTKYVAAKEKYEEKYEKSCEEEVGEQADVKATCAECAGVVCKWAASPSTNDELYDVVRFMPKEYVGCCGAYVGNRGARRV